MARPMTDVGIRGARARGRRYMLSDGGGLYLEVMPTGRKYWRFKYQDKGKRRMATLGRYPEVTLKEARRKVAEVYSASEEGISPAEVLRPAKPVTFQDLAEKWLAYNLSIGKWAASHAQRVEYRLRSFLYPALGAKAVRELTPPDLLRALRQIEVSGRLETMDSVKSIAGQVMRFGIGEGLCERDIARDLRGQLQGHKAKHMAAITTEAEATRLLRAMAAYHGSYEVRCALWFSFWTLARPGEVRHAEWDEIDLDAALWRKPALKMKSREEHLCPLPTQAVEMLRRLEPMTRRWGWLFPSVRRDGHPMSGNTINLALRTMGIAPGEMCAHGFRAMGSTLLNEVGRFRPDAIEKQLAHKESNATRAAYNRAEYLQERREMVQWYADWGGRVAAAGGIV